MKIYLALFACMCCFATAMPSTERSYEFFDLNEAPKLFEQFIKDHNKSYKDEADRQKHYEAFVINLKWINERNAMGESAVYGITQFADKTQEEWDKKKHKPVLVE